MFYEEELKHSKYVYNAWTGADPEFERRGGGEGHFYVWKVTLVALLIINYW